MTARPDASLFGGSPAFGDSPSSDAERGLLLVHAHPDDESLTTGVTMAHHAARGTRVTLVTCTRGERGEVIVPELAHLTGDALGAHRERELAAAMAALGVDDHRFLGAEQGVRYVDSGMEVTADGAVVLPDDAPPEAFSLAEVSAAGSVLAAVIDEVQPQVVLTYDPGGGYGHPDHVQAHRVTMSAVRQASWQVPAVYWVVVPRLVAAAEVALLAAPDNPFVVPPGTSSGQVGPLRTAVDDALVDVVVTGDERDVAAKVAALRAHATQVRVHEPFFALSNGIGQVIAPAECFRRAAAALVAESDPPG